MFLTLMIIFTRLRVDNYGFHIIVTFYRKKNFLLTFIILIFTFLILFTYNYEIGSVKAKDLIKGKTYNSSIVKFEFKRIYKGEKTRKDVEDKELIFITYANESYYLVEKNVNFDIDKDTPNVYIIPKGEIKYINLNKINN